MPDCQQVSNTSIPGRNRGLTSSGSRKEVLSNALKAEAGQPRLTCKPCSPMTSPWSPYATVSGLTALADLSALREAAFSNVVITFRGLDEVGNKAFAEWLVDADHTGPLVLSEDSVLEATGRHVQLPGVTVADFRDGKIRSYRTYFDDNIADRARSPAPQPAAVEFHVEDHPDPLNIDVLETQIRRRRPPPQDSAAKPTWRSSCATLARSSAGISGWTWGDCCELQNLWVQPSLRGRGLATRLIAAAEAEATARGCSQTVHFTYAFQARELYERNGYELVGSVENFPSGTDVLWYRKHLKGRGYAERSPHSRREGRGGLSMCRWRRPSRRWSCRARSVKFSTAGRLSPSPMGASAGPSGIRRSGRRAPCSTLPTSPRCKRCTRILSGFGFR